MSFLIHKMVRRKVSTQTISDSADPNKWPTATTWGNPPKWPSLVNSYAKNTSGIVTEEAAKKKQSEQKYRSIDDPWEEC